MRFPGNRIVKTAVAVFLTALLCELIGWPPVFAVITAIVTLEPTVSDSIKKGIIRFPASAIGSFYAVLFIAFFGNSPVTYTLAAALTIITCYQLKLHDGLLVATITAVAMIEVVYDHYLMSFLIRLGTTTIGIVVSTLVNLLIFPPNFMKEINENIRNTYNDIGHALLALMSRNDKKIHTHITKVDKGIGRIERLVRFESSDVEYFRLEDKKQSALTRVTKTLERLRFIQYHVNNLRIISLDDTSFDHTTKQRILRIITDLANFMIAKKETIPFRSEEYLREIMEWYWNSSHLPKEEAVNELPTELVLLYELISIFYLVEEMVEQKNNTN